jgi:HEAT repeat protein
MREESKVEALIRRLDVQGDVAARKVIALLRKIGRPAVPLLLVAAKDPSEPRIRKWSLEALGEIRDARGAGVLLRALKDERMTVRLHAVRGLGKMGLRRTAKPIARLLKDPSGGIRVNALYALIAIGDGSVAAAITRALRDPQWYVRQNACVACARLQVKLALPALRAMAKKDERKAVRSAALDAIRGLT